MEVEVTLISVKCLSVKRLFIQLRLFMGLVLMVLCCSSCALRSPAPAATESVHLLLGNPSHALKLDAARYKQILRSQYALLYDRSQNTAVWASWQLNQTWLGTLERPPFAPDPDLLKLGSAVVPNDYTNSGFDRGHLVPAADRNRTREDSAAVFYMSNIVPQAPDNNRGPWEALESYCRSLVQSGKELYITAGPVGIGGNGSDGNAAAIARGKITVPAALWKIIVVNEHPGLGPTGIDQNTRVIAVIMPNSQGIKNMEWAKFRTTVRDLEQQTGLDFLSNLPEAVQNGLETQPDRLKISKNKNP